MYPRRPSRYSSVLGLIILTAITGLAITATTAGAAGVHFGFVDSVASWFGGGATVGEVAELQPTHEGEALPDDTDAPLANQYFVGTTGQSLGSATTWGNSAAGPFNAPFAAGNTAYFSRVNGVGNGGSITVGGIVAEENFTIGASGGTISNFNNGVVPVTVLSGKLFEMGNQAFTGSATAGYNLTGPGRFATAGGAYGGGFTINSGTLLARGVNAMGGAATNTLTINGGTIAATASRDFTGKFSEFGADRTT